MPSAMEYVTPNDKARNTFGFAIRNEMQKRKEVYQTALDYYYGDADIPVEITEEDVDNDFDPTVDATIINLVRMGADRTTSTLFPELPDVQIDPESIEDTEEEKWLKEKFLVENGGLALLIKWALRGFLAGHTFLWVKNVKPMPKLVLLHPLAVTVFWKADDVNDVLWYEQRFIAQGTIYVRDFVKVKDDLWHIYLYKSSPENTNNAEKVLQQLSNHSGSDAAMYNLDFVQFGNSFERIEKAIHTSNIPPILDTPHLPDPDNFYGQGEFTEKDLMDIINKIASLRTSIVRENAEPTDYVTGADIDEIKGSGGLVTIPAERAKVGRLSLSSDLTAVNQTLTHLIEQFLAIMRVVILKGEAKDLQRVTNAAVRTLFLDALAKNAILWSSYSRTLSQAMKLALLYAYSNGTLPKQNPEDLQVVLKMSSPLPVDETELANIAALALNGKYMSQRTAATKLGLDYAFEEKAISTEFEQGLARQKETMELAATFTENEDSGDSNGTSDSKQMGVQS